MPSAHPSQPPIRAATTKQPAQKQRATSPPKKRKVFRRRGRARGELDSDDEIEREAASDSDGSNDLSSPSDTDESDTEPASEDVNHDRTHLPTPRNSKSPDSVAQSASRGPKDKALFDAPTNWSEMVADEKDNGNIPVIEFGDFKSTSVTATAPTPAPKGKKAMKAARAAAAATPPALPVSSAPSGSEPTSSETRTTPTPTQPTGPKPTSHNPRQAYQQRLQEDPSYVPTIGNFWGHDDRLMGPDLRSLSEWWRGKGRGRGRGRGGFRGVPRGGFRNVTPHPEPAAEEDLPPIEKQWTHDGFEDMRRKEEERRAQIAARKAEEANRGTFRPGRGARGRGGFARGGFSSPQRASIASPLTPSRVRFDMKPELMWTKQHEAFLFFDPGLKPRPGQGPGYRVRVPGKQSQIIRGPPSARPITSDPVALDPKAGSDPEDRNFVVRIPKLLGKGKAVEVAPSPSVTGRTPPVVELTAVPAETAKPLVLDSPPIPEPIVETTPLPPSQPSPQSEEFIRSRLEKITIEPQAPDPQRSAQTELAVLRHPSTENSPTDVTPPAAEATPQERPPLHPLQTTFTPPPPPPPQQTYGSPYAYPLPLGVAIDPHGMTYEVATGRPVYLQPMYAPRPFMHHNPYLPSHMHHPHAPSPDFSQPPHTPPANGFVDPATGTPLFSFPRQTTRVEIRAPDGTKAAFKPTHSSSSSRSGTNLRMSARPFEPSPSSSVSRPTEHNQEDGYYYTSGVDYDNANGIGGDEGSNVAANAGMMAPPYPAYHHPHQPYYYPEPYGYNPYMNMAQPVGQYDIYNTDPPQGTVYY